MIVIIAEYANRKLRKSTYEMVTAARSTGREGPIAILVLGSGVATIANEAAQIADQVLVGDTPALAKYDPQVWAAAAAQIAQQGEVNTVMIGGSRSGREYSPRVAVRLDAPLLEDVISLESNGAALRARRFSFLARVTETIEAEAPAIVVTVKPGYFEPAIPSGAAAEQFDVELQLPQSCVQVTGKIAESSSRVALTEADVVVTGGRGIGSHENFANLVEALADQIGAGVGATRAVVDEGWRPYAEQIGQTGKTVQPRMYVALAVSGAVQHLSGMGKSKYIVAVNNDPGAPIFKVADYGIVGDVHEIVPVLMEKAGSMKRV